MATYPLTSVVMNTLEQLRGIMDDPEVQGRYTNDYLLKHIIRPSVDKVISSISNSTSSPIINLFPITASGTLERVTIPPNVRSVLMLVERINNINVAELRPRHVFHNQGRGWSIEGQDLVFDPPVDLGSTTSLHLVYEPSGSHSLVYDPASGPSNTEGYVSSTDSKRFYLAEQPLLGVVDTRLHAYAGATLRLFKTDSIDIAEEHWIEDSGYDSSVGRWYVTLKTDIVNYPLGTTKVHFELGPPYSSDLVEAITFAAALKAGTYMGMPADRMGTLTAQYRAALKNIYDRVSTIQARIPKSFQTETLDTPSTYLPYWGLV